jgi:hypothetical protein
MGDEVNLNRRNHAELTSSQPLGNFENEEASLSEPEGSISIRMTKVGLIPGACQYPDPLQVNEIV